MVRLYWQKLKRIWRRIHFSQREVEWMIALGAMIVVMSLADVLYYAMTRGSIRMR